MSHALGIIISTCPLADKYAKLMGCYCMGLDNDETSGILLYKQGTLRNMASELYNRFGTGACPQSLARFARSVGFDEHGNFDGKPVLSAIELKRLETIAPRLLNKKK